MNTIDFDKAVPPMPEGFAHAMEHALSKAKIKAHGTRRFKLRVALVAALVALCLLGTAFALTGGFGVLAFWREHSETTILPQAADLVTPLSDLPQLRTSRVIYRAQDAMVANGVVSVTIEAKPMEPGKYLVMDDDGWMDPKAKPQGSDLSYEQLALAQGKALLSIEPEPVTINGVKITGYSPSTKLDGETLYLFAQFDLPREAGPGPYTIAVEASDLEIFPSKEGKRHTHGENEAVQLTFTIDPPSDILDAMALSAPVSARGMTVKEATLTRTPFNSQITVTYTVDKAVAQTLTADSVYCSFFWMKDKDGLEAMEGEIFGANTVLLEEGEGGKTYQSTRTWQTVDAMPDAVTLRPYYWDSDSYGEPIFLTEKEGR